MSCQLRKMKMMAAASCEARPADTQGAKEVAARLQQMQAERAKQDQMWTATPVGGGNDCTAKAKYDLLPTLEMSGFAAGASVWGAATK